MSKRMSLHFCSIFQKVKISKLYKPHLKEYGPLEVSNGVSKMTSYFELECHFVLIT